MADRVIREKEEKLFDATITLLETSSSDPLRYRNARRDFEIALARYLQAAGWQNQKVVYLEKQGMTLLLPIQIIQSGDLSIRSAPAFRDSIRVLWMPAGPFFKGEIVDLKWISGSGDQEGYVLALFPDSLISLSWTDNTLIANATMVFDSASLSPVRSSFPAGLFLPSNQQGLQFVTTHLKTAQLLLSQNEQHGNSGTITVAMPAGADMTWRFLEGRDILKNPGDISLRKGTELTTDGIRSIRQLPETNMQVLLDQKGFLILASDTSQNPLWISDRAWGNRIFLIDSGTIAVSDSRSPKFILFEYLGGDGLHLLGQSPPLEGNVTAITAIGEGILVSTVTYDNAEIPWSQLHLIPEKRHLWNLPATPVEPKYANYSSELVFIPGGSVYLSNACGVADWTEYVPQIVWMNVYETLFRRGKGNYQSGRGLSPIPNLISAVEHDSSRTRWQFRLKPGVRFADGAPLTAGDVIASWQQNIKEYAGTNPASGWLWRDITGAPEFVSGSSKSIKGFEAMDKSTLRILLTKPISNFPMHLTSPVFGIKKSGLRWAIGTGPFKIVEIQRERSLFSITCERNPYYHRGMPPLQRLVFAFEVGNIIDFLSFRQNAAANIRRLKDVAYFREIQSLRVAPVPNDMIYFLALNPLSGSLSDVRLRRKIVSALDRQVIAKALTEAEAYPASRLLSQNRAGILGANSSPDYPGTVHPLTIAYNARDAVSSQIAERLATELSELDIPHRSPVKLSADGFRQSRQSGNYDILVDSYIPCYGDEAYNLAQICYRGYVLEKGITDKLGNIFDFLHPVNAKEIERSLIGEAVLYPIIRTRNYFVHPSELMDTNILGPNYLEFSRAWMPL